MNFLSNKKRSARMRPDACGICLLKQTASGAQSVTSPSKIEGFREFEADLSALFYGEKFTKERMWQSGQKEEIPTPASVVPVSGSACSGVVWISLSGAQDPG